MLDIGCGNAYILYYLREEHGVERVIGTQLSATAQAFARDTLNVDVRLGELPDLAPGLPKFSVITVWARLRARRGLRTLFRPVP